MFSKKQKTKIQVNINESIKVLPIITRIWALLFITICYNFIEREQQNNKQIFNSVSEVQTFNDIYKKKPIFHFVPELYHNDSLFQLSNSTKRIEHKYKRFT